MDLRTQQEAVGANYDRAMMLVAREKTRRVIQEIAREIAPGMLEEAALEMARERLKEAELLRGWHGIHVRFGENTLKRFGEPSEPNTMLREDDIFFIDIGPVWQKWEGDGGDTFVVGGDAQMHAAARDVKELFRIVHGEWRKSQLTGAGLYQFARERASAMSWELNLDMSGHRLADFPHSAIHKGALADADYSPTTDLWVLELQIRHPERRFSAFYEDMLLEDI
jgi:Xaa-Pro aminopeptidase